ncbi:hypothetical protein RSOLAG1IB_07600 [Rhizoctonia solani AG-1 IB]|uniref:ABM domain-containing protein n=1 Tax=Thanatephorus cucumeris (strain AG1-IB / isolate 7/3/14) TaxID=1108050 RepID=A0A0B7FJ37_THACB|nr:hypothetical protein RSOLAG1IB_07600 [Rhizoctonia solani AG-1 IB]
MDNFQEIGKLTGRFLVIATSTAKEGQADKLEAHLKAVKEHALSDKEPGCFIYSVGRYGNEFVASEGYESQAAFQAHIDSDVFKSYFAVVGTLTEGDTKILFYEDK